GQLKSMPMPESIAPSIWHQVVADADRFLVTWGATAAALGWTAPDLFGVHRQKPMARYDAAGLVVLLDGGDIVALTADCAEIRTRSGALQRYRRRPFHGSGQVLLWELPGRV